MTRYDSETCHEVKQNKLSLPVYICKEMISTLIHQNRYHQHVGNILQRKKCFLNRQFLWATGLTWKNQVDNILQNQYTCMFPELSDTAQIAAWSKLQSITCTIMSTNNLQKLVSTCKINTNMRTYKRFCKISKLWKRDMKMDMKDSVPSGVALDWIS